MHRQMGRIIQMGALRCKDCLALAGRGDMICQRCGGEIGPDEPPVVVADPEATAAVPAALPPATDVAAVPSPKRRTRKLAILMFAAALAVAGFFAYRTISSPISVTAVDEGGNLAVSNRTDETIAVEIQKKRGEEWTTERDEKEIGATKTRKFKLKAGTYRVLTGDFESGEVTLTK